VRCADPRILVQAPAHPGQERSNVPIFPLLSSLDGAESGSATVAVISDWRLPALEFLTGFLTMEEMRATVTSKGQITIPQAIRKKLHLEPGTVLDFDERASHLKATKAIDAERMRSVIGIGKAELADKTVDEWLDELRGSVEIPQRRRG